MGGNTIPNDANGGNLVATLISGKVADVDSRAVQSSAVAAIASGNSAWQYSSAQKRGCWPIA